MAIHYLYDTAMLQPILDTLAMTQSPIYEAEHEYFADALHWIRTISDSNQSYYNLSNAQLELSMQMANQPYGHAVIMRNIISDVRGDVFQYPFEYPQPMQPRLMQSDSTAPNALDSVFNNSFTLYPNPNNGNFEISYNIGGVEPLQLTLYDILGKPCGQWALESGNKIISLQAPACGQGYYIYRLTQAKVQIQTGRIILIR